MPDLTPLDAYLENASTLAIRWPDGLLHHPAHIVRAQCPCATCRDEDRVRDPATHAALSYNSVEEVGNYALQIGFSDGHNLGIYPFAKLHATGFAPGEAPDPEGENAPFAV